MVSQPLPQSNLPTNTRSQSGAFWSTIATCGLILFFVTAVAAALFARPFASLLSPYSEFNTCANSDQVYSEDVTELTSFAQWQQRTYGNVACETGSETGDRRQQWMAENPAEAQRTFNAKSLYWTFDYYKNGLPLFASVFAFPWFIRGLIGGLRLASHRLVGKTGMVILTALTIPVGIFFLYLFFMMLLGNFSYAWSQKSKPDMIRCPHCRSYIPRDATVCGHCTRPVI
jgi:hypothetical protein